MTIRCDALLTVAVRGVASVAAFFLCPSVHPQSHCHWSHTCDVPLPDSLIPDIIAMVLWHKHDVSGNVCVCICVDVCMGWV